MPDTMAGNISKGRILRLLDAVLYTGENVTSTINALGNPLPSLSAVFHKAVQLALANNASNLRQLNSGGANYNNLNATERTHINEHWFGGQHQDTPQGQKGRSYWPGVAHPAVTVREAYLAALETSSAAGVLTRPVVTYWLCAGSSFEVAVCNDSPLQSTVMLMTPSIAWRYLGARRGLPGGAVKNDDNPDASLTEDENIHVFADLPQIEEVVAEAAMPVLHRPGQRNDNAIAADPSRLGSAGGMNGGVHRYQVIGDADNFTN